MKYLLIIAAVAVFAIGASGTAFAFHSGGVAECEGCHAMHAPKAGGSFLMVGTDQSSTCLTCHEHAGDLGPSSYHISTASVDLTPAAPPKQRTPGGDFGWLKRNYSDSSVGTTPGSTPNVYSEDGRSHGHNIVAADFGYVADSTNTMAPGGTFPAAQLGCQSCHDPHGQFRRLQSGSIAKTGLPTKASGSYPGNEPTATEAVGVYRLLAGAGYTKGPASFTGVPAAKAPSTYNQTEATNQVRVAYGVSTAPGHVSWGEWCATCHTGRHSAGGNYVHPVDEGLGSTIAGLYGQYVKSGDMAGSAATSFSSLVPFATNSGDYTALAALASNAGSDASKVGPSSTDQVTCLSCHRAHASGNMHGLRFDNGYEFTTVAGQYVAIGNPAVTGSRAALQRRGRTVADWEATYYDRPASQFATYQRVLCNKCHAKD